MSVLEFLALIAFMWSVVLGVWGMYLLDKLVEAIANTRKDTQEYPISLAESATTDTVRTTPEKLKKFSVKVRG